MGAAPRCGCGCPPARIEGREVSLTFRGNDRFAIRRRLGEGGMGVVYEAFDRERNEAVALKTLTRVDASGIYRLKKEFRSLADVVHPNLVALYDLVSVGRSDWFFTMELVPGESFLDYVRGDTTNVDGMLTPPWNTAASVASAGATVREGHGSELSPTPSRNARSTRSRGAVAPDPEQPKGVADGWETTLPAVGMARREPGPPLDPARLRRGLVQLVQGINAIHAAGKLHRDLKPTNVLVTRAGRVVILDFGLVQENLDATEERSLEENLVAGTPAYMAPEQAAGERVLPASDWYAVGVMLYRALCGRLPFSGGVRDILAAKQSHEPQPPSLVVTGVPPDLDELCVALLRRDPARRPAADEIESSLNLDPSPITTSAPPPPPESDATPFVGRRGELGELDDAFDEARAGAPRLVLISGSAGVGKTALVQRFLRRVRGEPAATILSGRCFQRESVPYQALDQVVDELSRRLGWLPSYRVEALLPRNVADLVRLFPVLGRVEAVARAPQSAVPPADEGTLRQRGFRALGELLGRLADRSPLVIFVDDLQWGDTDSAELLLSLLLGSDAPPMLLVGCYREDWARSSPLLLRLRTEPLWSSVPRTRHLHLGPLRRGATVDLARRLLGETTGAPSALVEWIARTAEGIPLLVAELSRHAASLPRAKQRRLLKRRSRRSLDPALEAIGTGLSPELRRLLLVVAAAGAPVEQSVVSAAARLRQPVREAVAALAARRLVATLRRQGRDAVELANDRIRDHLLHSVSASERRDLHRRLAVALEDSGRAEPETLASHYRAAGDADRAAEHALRGAERALAALAFDHAAASFGLALELGAGGPEQRWSLLARMGEALAGAGRTADAARQLIAASRAAPPERAFRLARRATELQLQSMQVDTLVHTSRPAEQSLFDGIARAEVQWLVERSTVIEGREGQLLAGKGNAANSFFVVLSGTVDVRRGDAPVATLSEGAVLGEIAFLLKSQRHVDVFAASNEVRLLALSQSSFDELAETKPRLALTLTLNLSRVLCSKLEGLHRRTIPAGGDD